MTAIPVVKGILHKKNEYTLQFLALDMTTAKITKVVPENFCPPWDSGNSAGIFPGMETFTRSNSIGYAFWVI